MCTVERGSSLVECRTRNQESLSSNPPLLPFRSLAFSFASRRLSRLSCIYDSGGHVSEESLRNCCMARMFPREAGLVLE